MRTKVVGSILAALHRNSKANRDRSTDREACLNDHRDNATGWSLSSLAVHFPFFSLCGIMPTSRISMFF
jgi:hypothetical protein